jgi:hypothetical protein
VPGDHRRGTLQNIGGCAHRCPHATTEGTERCPDFGRHAPLYAVHYTLRAKMPVPARLRVRFHSPRSGLPRKVTPINEGHWRYHRAPVGFVHERERRKSCSDRVPIRARRVRVDRVQVGGGSSGLLVPAMQRDTDLRHYGIEDVDGARIAQDGVAYSTDRTHDPLE